MSNGTNASVVQLHLKWNVEGALKKFFWRLAGGSMACDVRRWKHDHRSRTPCSGCRWRGGGSDSCECRAYARTLLRRAWAQVESIVIAGEGAKYLENQLRI